MSLSLQSLAGHSGHAHFSDPDLWGKIAHPEDRDLQAAVLSGRTGTESPVVIRWLTPHGNTLWIQQQTVPRFDEDGQLVELAGVVRDITAERQAEAALLQATQRLNAHIDNSPLAVVEFDPAFRVIRWSQGAERMFGWRPAETLGRAIEELRWVYEEDRELVRQVTVALLTGQRPRHVNVNRNYTKDGRLLHCEWYSSAIYNADGSLQSVLSLALDITQKREAEAALRQSEQWLRESQHASRIGTYALNARTGTWTNSESLDEIFGLGPGFVRDIEGWEMLLHPDDREEMIRYFRDDVLGKGQAFDREYRIVRKRDGEVRWVLGRGALVRDEEGNLSSMMGTIQDVTERRLMEDDLRQAQKMESIGRLAGGLAHDFNNLLTVINGYCSIILSGKLSAERLKSSVSEIQRAGERAATLTQQMLAFSRRQMLLPKVLDLNEVVVETERMLRRLIGEDILLETRLATDLWRVKADADQLSQALLNLAANARDAMPQGGKLMIETSNVEAGQDDGQDAEGWRAGDAVALRITDTGTGIDDRMKQHLFEPFYTTKPPGSGTGLGLSSVYGVVRQSGGWIQVWSRPGGGTRFSIFLPRAESDAEEAPGPTPAAPELQAGGGETILVAEDQESVRQLAARVLQRVGYHVLEAANGSEAVQMANAHPGKIALLLTDMVMPGMAGPALARKLRERWPALPVLYMSGYADDFVSGRGLLEVPGGFLPKPFGVEQLALKVKEALREALDEPGGA